MRLKKIVDSFFFYLCSSRWEILERPPNFIIFSRLLNFLRNFHECIIKERELYQVRVVVMQRNRTIISPEKPFISPFGNVCRVHQ